MQVPDQTKNAHEFYSVAASCGDLRSRLNPLSPELNPICYLLALLAHDFLHVSRIRVKSLTLRLLMSYIYMKHLFLIFLDHTQRRSTVGRTPLDEWSARRRDLYLTTHDTHHRQISIPPVGFEPKISVSFSQKWSGLSMKLTTHCHYVMKTRMWGASSLLPCKSSAAKIS
jgi:hypothetical protein